jgi:hypothetical protein
MKSTPRVRAALAVGALMTAVGLGAVATPFLAAASASTIDNTPSTTISKTQYEAAHPGTNTWGKAMSNPSAAFCSGAKTSPVAFTGNTTVPLAANVGMVVIHAGSYVFIWTPGTAGVQYRTPKVNINGNMVSQAISWAVTCGEGESSSSSTVTPTETESGTSDPCASEGAPESCSPDPCSTENAEVPASCTPDPCSTENAEIPASCTPDPCTVDPQAEGCGGTVISSPPATTSTPAGDESVEAASTTAAASLAHTGGNGMNGVLLALGLLLAAGGAALMLMTRRTGSHA